MSITDRIIFYILSIADRITKVICCCEEEKK